MSSYEKLLETCENHIRSGQDHQVARIMSTLNSARVPRKWRLPLANLCRRTSQITMGMRLLAPAIRIEKGTREAPPSPAELAEYAILLQRSGAPREALRILESVDTSALPEAQLYRAFCHFNLWDYEASLPHLESYLARPLQPYAALIGYVNLAAALVATDRNDRARELLRECIETATAGGFTRLLGNSHELLAQIHIHDREFDEAARSLAVADGIFTAPHALERLLTDKCKAFLEARKTGSPEPLLRFREKALAWSHGETLRETDLFTLMVDFDEQKFEHLFYGTPFPAYRARMKRWLQREPSSTEFIYGAKDSPCLDLSTGHCSSHARLAAGSVTHRVISALLQDFYRPLSVSGLFSMLFPDEHFNIFNSPARVHQALRRTRKWFEDHELPVQIVKQKGKFVLQVHGSFSFRVQQGRRPKDSHEVLLERLGAVYGTKAFTAKEAREHLGLSLSAMQRFLMWASDEEAIERFGAGNSTVYNIKGDRLLTAA